MDEMNKKCDCTCECHGCDCCKDKHGDEHGHEHGSGDMEMSKEKLEHIQKKLEEKQAWVKEKLEAME